MVMNGASTKSCCYDPLELEILIVVTLLFIILQVRGLPTLYFMSPDPNKDAIRTEGLIPIQMMRDIIDNQM